MRYLGVAFDYDGTVAQDGTVDDATIRALTELRTSGRRLILVTGRELEDLLKIFPRPDLFEAMVLENGAVLYRPEIRTQRLLAPVANPDFVDALRGADVTPLSVGQVIVATTETHRTVVLDLIHKLGLELQVIFNKGAVMVLPSGVNKATGLAAALAELGLSPHNVVTAGDAENDHALLQFAEAGVAVANALPALKESADFVTEGEAGAGIRDLIHELMSNDLARIEPKLTRHHLLVGHDESGAEVRIPPYGQNIMIAGSSGGGKSTLVTALIERLIQKKYQVCVIDPEGDYDAWEGIATLGTTHRAPSVHEVMNLLEKPGESVAVMLVGLKLDDRPAYFQTLLPQLQELRFRTGRPHWIVVDEAHHVLPAFWEAAGTAVSNHWRCNIYVTVNPGDVSQSVLETVDTVFAVGDAPGATLAQIAHVAAIEPPEVDQRKMKPGAVLCWRVHTNEAPREITIEPAQAALQRYRRTYAEGDLGTEPSQRITAQKPPGPPGSDSV